MYQQNRPIGVLDSGMGGLTVLRPAARALPRERFIYYGDNRHAPYGILPEGDILRHTLAAADALMAEDIKLLLIACNTATSVAAEALRAWLPIPVVAMEPALKPASQIASSGQILVLATPATLALPRFRESMTRYGQRATAVPLRGLVEVIENGETSGARVEGILRDALLPALGTPTDAIVLGCTHYPFVRPVIEALTPGTPIWDGTAGTLRQMERLLREGYLLRSEGEGGVVFQSSEPAAVARMEALYMRYLS